MLRRTTNPVLLVSPDGRVLGASDAAAAALGCSSGAALVAIPARELASRFTPESADGRDTVAAGRWMPGDRQETILRFRDPAGGWDRWALIRALPPTLGEPRAGRLHVVQDITGFRRREQAARLLDEATLRLTRALTAARVMEHAAVAAVPVLGDESVVVERGADGNFVPRAWCLPGAPDGAQAQALVEAMAPLLQHAEGAGRTLLLRTALPGDADGDRRSVVVAPARDGGETLALLILAMASDTGRRHHPSDRLLAEQLGQRVGRALSDARLQQAERQRLLAAAEREAVLAHLGSELQTQLPTLLRACDRLERTLPESERRVLRTIREQSNRLNATMDRMFRDGAPR
jgi:hypothetical protein